MKSVDIVKRNEELRESVQDLEKAIKSLRPGNYWETDIAQDGRLAVKKLYILYNEAVHAYRKFTAIDWQCDLNE